jgi:hypothetical protein
MPKMIIMVLDDVDKLHEVMDAWQAAGAGGVTILESSGLGRLILAGGRDDLPLFPRLRNLLEKDEIHHRTLFTVLEDRIDIEAFFDATEAVVGPLDTPNSGVILALPVLSARGVISGEQLSRRGGMA